MKEPTQPKDAQQRPSIERLYRYRSLGRPNDDKHLEPIFTKNELYFPCPAQLNDPFDCLVPSFDRVPRSKLKKFVEQRFKEKAPLWNRAERRRQSKVVTQQHILDRIHQQLLADVSKLGILCLSAKCNDLLMWSHYANGHRGLCLEFEASDYTPFFGAALPVMYRDDRPTFDPDGTQWQQVESAVLTKSKGWSYEEEWRVIDHDQGHGVHQFPTRCLTGVIFGCATSEEDKDRILNWITKTKPDLAFYQAHRSKHAFALDIAPLNDPHI